VYHEYLGEVRAGLACREPYSLFAPLIMFEFHVDFLILGQRRTIQTAQDIRARRLSSRTEYLMLLGFVYRKHAWSLSKPIAILGASESYYAAPLACITCSNLESLSEIPISSGRLYSTNIDELPMLGIKLRNGDKILPQRLSNGYTDSTPPWPDT
jgi:hypothetical protein